MSWPALQRKSGGGGLPQPHPAALLPLEPRERLSHAALSRGSAFLVFLDLWI